MWYPIAQTLLLARMSWEDFTTRTINLWLFIAWGVVVAFGPHQDYRTVLLNIGITLAQVLVILLYTALKSKGEHKTSIAKRSFRRTEDVVIRPRF